MKNKEQNRAIKKATIRTLDVMIEHADKGPSGFWAGDQEGCGNPQIFPEFEKGLKGGASSKKSITYVPGTHLFYMEALRAMLIADAITTVQLERQNIFQQKC